MTATAMAMNSHMKRKSYREATSLCTNGSFVRTLNGSGIPGLWPQT